MLIRALPAGMQRFTLADLPLDPWRNGGGRTRVVAASHDDTRLRWRVSAADIDRDGAFSVFDGLDRSAVLMRGAGLSLRGAHQCMEVAGVGALARFDGGTPLHAELASGPVRLWNVMAARDAVWADVQVHHGGQGTLAPANAAVLVVLDGTLEVAVDDAALFRLQPEEGLRLTGFMTPLSLRAQGPSAHWVTTLLEDIQ